MPRWPKRKPRPGVDEYGRTPLWYRALQGDLAGARREIEAGADPSAGDDAGHTPLHAAVQERHLDMVAMLLESGADPNRTDAHGNLPIWNAILNAGALGSRPIIELLVRAGTNTKTKNRYGRSPRDLATEIGHGVDELLAGASD